MAQKFPVLTSGNQKTTWACLQDSEKNDIQAKML